MYVPVPTSTVSGSDLTNLLTLTGISTPWWLGVGPAGMVGGTIDTAMVCDSLGALLLTVEDNTFF